MYVYNSKLVYWSKLDATEDFFTSPDLLSIVNIRFRVLDMSLEFILCAFDLTMIGAFCRVKYVKDWFVNYDSVRGESD
jgi:hypothetical protein